MNDNFNFSNGPQNEIYMDDTERKSHKKIFSKLALAFVVYLLVSEALSIAAGYTIGYLAPHLLANTTFVLIISSVIQYLVAFPIFYVCLKSLPKYAPIRTPVGYKRVFKYLTVGVLAMYIGNNISSFLMEKISLLLNRVPENSVDTLLNETNIWASVLIVGIIGPIFEELMFRKLFIDRLTRYGEVVAIFFPSLIFALFHGNLYQFFYAFFIGVVLSYVYMKTGNILYSTGLHIFTNLFFGVLPTLVFTMLDYNELITLVVNNALTEEYIAAHLLPIILLLIYSYGMLIMAGIGFFVLFRNFRNIHLAKGEVRFPKGVAADVIFFNGGTIALITISILTIALNTFG